MGATGPIGSDTNIVCMVILAAWASTVLTGVAPRQLGQQGRTRALIERFSLEQDVNIGAMGSTLVPMDLWTVMQT
jgi:hypothetical protein